jgi:dUTP pyrophosphatase
MESNLEVKYIKIGEDAIEPTRGSAAAAGYDLYVPGLTNDIIIPAHETVKIDIGIAIALPDNTFGAIFARSGLATKQGLRPANCVGR